MNILLLLVATLAGSYVLTALLRRYALSRNVIDVPNERSSHSVPTPRGGGVAIVVSFLMALGAAAALGMVNSTTAVWIGIGAVMIAVVGFIDDHNHIAAGWRLLVHFSGATCVVMAIGGLVPLTFLGSTIDFGWVGHVLAVVAVVWMINLTNFMDGIDGIASVQTIFLSSGLAFLSWCLSDQLPVLPLLVAVAAAGFLCWNFPPARIFMGDAGSGCLGLLLAALILYSASQQPLLFWSGVILFGVFIVDATFTLTSRLKRGKKLYEAHRSHTYQIASRRYGSHKIVTLTVALINLIWLLPLAALVAFEKIDGVFTTLIAYAPLVAAALYFKAGQDE